MAKMSSNMKGLSEVDSDFLKMAKKTFGVVGKMHLALALLIVILKMLDLDEHLSLWSHILVFVLALFLLVSGLLLQFNVVTKKPTLCFVWTIAQIVVLMPAIYIAAWNTGTHLNRLSRASSESAWRPWLAVALYSCHLACLTLSLATVALMRAAARTSVVRNVRVDEDARTEYLGVALGHATAFVLTLAFHVLVLVTSRVTAFRVFMVVVCNGFLYCGAAITSLFVAFKPNALNLCALGSQSVVGGLSALVPLLLSLLMMSDAEYIYWAPINLLISAMEIVVAVMAALIVFREISYVREQRQSAQRRV